MKVLTLRTLVSCTGSQHEDVVNNANVKLYTLSLDELNQSVQTWSAPKQDELQAGRIISPIQQKPGLTYLCFDNDLAFIEWGNDVDFIIKQRCSRRHNQESIL